MSNEYRDWVADRIQDLEYAEKKIEILEAANKAQSDSLSKESRRLLDAKALLEALLQRAYMRMDYHEADEIADFLGVKRPSDHEMEDL